MKSRLFLSTVMIMFLSGCGLLQSVRENLTIEQKERFIHSAAQTGVTAAILNIYDDKQEQVDKATELKKTIDEDILSLLSDPNATIDEATEKLLFKKLPSKYAVYTQSAVTLMRLYYTTPELGEIIGNENWRLLVALFQGMSDGCEMIINL